MFSGVTNSKELIKNRMLKHALNYWNIRNTDELDPVVKLILEALSSELYNLGNDIKDTEVRLLEKLANLLAPEFLTCPNPAHGILHATPNEPEEVLAENTHFLTEKKISSRQDETLDKILEIFFTPVDKVRLFNTRILYTVTGTNLFAYDQNLNKQLAAHTISGRRAENNVLWLGLAIDDKITSLNNIVFYFDWKNTEYELSGLNYQLLGLTSWHVNETSIRTTEGIHYDESDSDDNLRRNLSDDYDLLTLIEKDIKNYYDRKFITVQDNSAIAVSDQKREYPVEFKNIFNEADLQKLNKKLLWIKIGFPAAFQQSSLDEVYVFTNAFPVMDRRLIDTKPRLKGGSNIIPLRTTGVEQFLAVRSLSDERHQYQPTPFRKTESEQTGTYTVRSGGVERFDGRNAKEFINYLLELLRSESAAFSAYGNDFIASTLREVNQRIALMEQKVGTLVNNNGEIPHYIIAKPYEGSERMYAEYWVALAEMANGLRSGTRLQEYNSAKVKPDTLFLLSSTTGGRNRLKPEERVNAFKYGLMTRNRIVTKEDIRNFCYYELGGRASKVVIEKGFEISPHPKQSFQRTIDITVTATPSERLTADGWQALLGQLRTKLQSRSGMSNYYRIFLKR